MAGVPRSRPRIYVEPRMPRWWDRLIVGLTLVAIVLLLLDLGLDRDSPAAQAIGWTDFGLCMLFLADFGARFRRAERRWEFLRRNWIDVLGSIPFVGPLRAARAVRLVRLLRLMRVAVLVRKILQRHDVQVPRSLRYIALVAAAIWLAAGGAFYAFEVGVNQNVHGFDDALWWSITTLSTVGYGDMYPLTAGGRVAALVTMVLGVGVLGTLAGSLATAFIEARGRARKGLRAYAMRNHLLVLGWNDHAPAVMDEFVRDPRHADTPIVLVADLEALPVEDSTVRFVRGSTARRSSLERACAADAAAVVVLASDPLAPESDLRTALTVGAVRRLNPSVPISAELVYPKNRELVEEAGCSAIVNASLLVSALLVRGIQDMGSLELVHDLLSNTGGSQIYRIKLPASQTGHTFRECAAALLDRRATLVAVARGSEIVTNPDPELCLTKNDEVFVVSRVPPVFE